MCTIGSDAEALTETVNDFGNVYMGLFYSHKE